MAICDDIMHGTGTAFCDPAKGQGAIPRPHVLPLPDGTAMNPPLRVGRDDGLRGVDALALSDLGPAGARAPTITSAMRVADLIPAED